MRNSEFLDIFSQRVLHGQSMHMFFSFGIYNKFKFPPGTNLALPTSKMKNYRGKLWICSFLRNICQMFRIKINHQEAVCASNKLASLLTILVQIRQSKSPSSWLRVVLMQEQLVHHNRGYLFRSSFAITAWRTTAWHSFEPTGRFGRGLLPS